MTRFIPSLAVASALALTGCSESATRYAVPDTPVSEQTRIRFASVEIEDVSLPTYAASEEIFRVDATGALRSSNAVLWADDPERAIALELSRALTRMTGARIAAAPWPFDARPQARVDMRFTTLVAGDDGQYRVAGQYFVAQDGGGRERSAIFDLSAPFDPAAGPAAIAAARGQAIAQLARAIARDGLR